MHLLAIVLLGLLIGSLGLVSSLGIQQDGYSNINKKGKNPDNRISKRRRTIEEDQKEKEHQRNGREENNKEFAKGACLHPFKENYAPGLETREYNVDLQEEDIQDQDN